MADGLQVITQADFSAGAFPGLEDIPPNGVEDIVDGFLRDDGAVERRGGTVYETTADAGSAGNYGAAVTDAFFPSTGSRQAVWLLKAPELKLLRATGTATQLMDLAANFSPTGRPVMAGSMLMFPIAAADGTPYLLVYGGHTADAGTVGFTGTVTATLGSATVAGSGTDFLTAGAVAGMLLRFTIASQDRLAVIKSVESNTSLTLAEPWPYETTTTSSGNGVAVTSFQLSLLQVSANATPVALATAGERLLIGKGDVIRMSSFNESGSGATLQQHSAWFENENQDFHKLPAGVLITGMEPLGEIVYVFTTGGVWLLAGISQDITDEFGNPAHQLQQVSRDLILWGDMGLASCQGSIVVPALDDLYLLGEQTRAVTGGARRLYREYVTAGYKLGVAAVHRGHYLLPILDSADTVIDTLVWRLDRIGDGGAPFMRWAGHAGDVTAFTVAVGEGADREPQLLGTAGRRVLNLTDCFQPSAAVKQDADGVAHQLEITSRSIMLSETQDHTLRKGRLRYELDDAASDNPTFTAEWARGRPGSSFTALSGAALEGEDPYAWTLAKAGQQTRMRFTSNNAAAKAVVRAMEFHVRQHGRV